MKASKRLFLLLGASAGLLLAGCAADESKGLCSYLGGCTESDDDDDSAAAAPAASRGTSHETNDHGAGGGHDEGGEY